MAKDSYDLNSTQPAKAGAFIYIKHDKKIK